MRSYGCLVVPCCPAAVAAIAQSELTRHLVHIQANPENWAACAQAAEGLNDLDAVLSSLKLAAQCLLLRELLSAACQKRNRPAYERMGSSSSW